MGKAIIVFFTILLIIALYVTFGSNYLPFFGQSPKETQKKIDVGFSSNNFSYDAPLYSFEDVAARADAIAFDNGNMTNLNTTQDNHILYIRGRNLNEVADAESWAFAVRHGNLSSVVTYDRYGESIVDWPSGFPGQEIPLNQIIPPKELFYRNMALISNGGQANITISKDLTLTGSNYTLTLSGNGKVRTLQFDALSGALISSND